MILMEYSAEKNVILQDYDEAVLTLLWCIHEGVRKLIFSTIELFPKECVDYIEIKEQTVQVKVGKVKPYPRIFYCRKKVSTKDALTIYQECSLGIINMTWDKEKNGQIKKVVSSAMMEIPLWPAMTLSKNEDKELTPFLPKWWGMCRIHHLLSKEPDKLVMQLVAHEMTLDWMKDRLLWDISGFPELIGSMHLILPNPVYRYVEERLIPSSEERPEHVSLNFVLRKGQSIDGLKVITAERVPFGIVNVKEYQLDNPSIEVKLAGKAEEFATAVICKNRGMLEYTGFGSFIRGICVNIGIVNAIRQVNLPDSDESYQVQIAEEEIKNIGDKANENIIALGQKLTLRSWKKKDEELAEKLEQHLFEMDSQKEARNFIADIIQKARKRVIIVDPYFATMELYNYIYRIPTRDVCIEIITSAEALKDKSKLSVGVCGEPVRKGQELLKDIKLHEKGISKKTMSVYVMTGKPMIHDRFLLIDDKVWFSGNSLNNIGDRASMIIQLPDSEEIIRLINDVRENKERIKTLEEWAKCCETDDEQRCLIEKVIQKIRQVIKRII